MRFLRNVPHLLAFVIPTSTALIACGGGTQAAPTTASVRPGDMPSGATWDGVYFSPLYGNLHLVQASNNVNGRWKRTDGSAWGELNGTLIGNVMHFEWTEHKVGQVGPTSITKGKGFFVYKRPEGENVDDRIDGGWGLESSEVGNAWDGVKQRNVKADLKSVVPMAEAAGPSKDWR